MKRYRFEIIFVEIQIFLYSILTDCVQLMCTVLIYELNHLINI